MSWLNLILSDGFLQKGGEGIAIAAPDGILTYSKLGLASDAIAHLVKGRMVAIILPRSKWFPAAAIGVMKAGCIYMPVRYTLPTRCVSSILEWAEAGTVITVSEYADTHPELFRDEAPYRTILMDKVALEEGSGPFAGRHYDDSPALLICTSGTTGQPKGILHSIGSLSFLASPDIIPKGICRPEETHTAVIADFSFIASAVDMFFPLTLGSTVHIIGEEIVKDIGGLTGYLNYNGIIHTTVSAGMARLIASSGGQSARIVGIVGERMAPISPKEADSARFVNVYGLTECGRVTAYNISGLEPSVPVGKPYRGVEVYLLSDNRTPVVQGETGEIAVSSPGLALCYFKDKHLTSERFIMSSDGKKKTMFLTGDLARYDRDGNLVLLGRRDNLLKIRGFRIETGDVENAAVSYPGVIYASLRPSGNNRTVLFYDGAAQEDSLLIHLKSLLPEYMIPDRLIRMEQIPVNANGKTDTDALDILARQIPRRTFVNPAPGPEAAIAEAMERVLHRGNIGAEDDFFDLGGDSLSALALVMESTGLQLSSDMIHRWRTPRSIALNAIQAMDRLAGYSIDADISARKRPMPLNPTQRAILDIQSIKPGSRMWNNPLLFKLNGNTDITILVNALKKTVKNHPVLSATLEERADGAKHFIYNESAPANISIKEAGDDKLEDVLSSLTAPFGQADGSPLYSIGIIITPSKRLLFLDFHHVICDGASIRLFISNLIKSYQGIDIPYDFNFLLSDKMRETHLAAGYVSAEEYIRRKYGDADWTKVPVPDLNGSGHTLGLWSGGLAIASDSLESISGSRHISLNVLLIAAAAQALSFHSGKNDVMINWVYNNRRDSVSGVCFGTFIQSPRVCLRMDTFDNAAGLLDEVSQQINDGIAASQVEWKPEFAALEVNNMTDLDSSSRFPASIMKRIDIPSSIGTDSPSEQFSITLRKSDGSFLLEAGYDASLYSSDCVNGFMRKFVEVFLSLAENTDNRKLTTDICFQQNRS